MAKSKKHQEEEEHENSERWLLTYSDMITLLLALFIILYSMSTINAKKVAQMAQNFGVAMGTASTDGKINQNGDGGGSGNGNGGGNGNGTGSGTGYGYGTGVQIDALDEVYSILNDYVNKNHLQNSVGLDNTDTYVKIQLKDTLMFVPDSSTMLSSSEPVLEKIEGAIAQVYNRVDRITFSGHTADVGPHTAAADQVSWRLSTERAVTVLNKMISYGLPQDKISIEGYAHFSPVANNNTEEGRAKNRRVEITIYKEPAKSSDSSSTAASSSSSASSASSSPQVIITKPAPFLNSSASSR